ncbi:MAG: NAD(+) synthase [Coriobacteriales bacterium]|jgi:NAD+ synthase (glutamine-hydrolysing)|nr:NAD(+) synthase [Coriobacteriales bacterium]
METTMYIAIVQFNPKVGALRENTERALAELNRLASETYPPDLVVFPAFALTGEPIELLQFYPPFAAECIEIYADFCNRAPLPTIIGTYYPQFDPYTARLTCLPEVIYAGDGDGEILHFSDIVYEENDPYDDSFMRHITINDTSVAIMFNESPDYDESFEDYDVVVVLEAAEFTGEEAMLMATSQTDEYKEIAKDNNVWYVIANLAGAADSIVYEGTSMIISPVGKIVAAAPAFTEQTICYNLSNAAMAKKILLKPQLQYEAYWNVIVCGIRDYHYKNGFSDCVIGLSGGIDSSLVCALAVEALGADHVHGVLMPSQNSSSDSIKDAKELASILGVKTITLPINTIYDAFMLLYEHALSDTDIANPTLTTNSSCNVATGKDKKADSDVDADFSGSKNRLSMKPEDNIALQNIQARIRMLHLMHLSNTFNWLLLNTGNRSEAAMGYSTLYGDTAGAIAPIGNLYKVDVYGVARWRNERGLVIPDAILNKPPSAELYPGQRDCDSLPDYDILDVILRLHLNDGMGADQILVSLRECEFFPEITPEIVLDTLSRVSAAEFKRSQEPMAIRIDDFSFAENRHWPTTNGFVDRDRKLKTDVEVFRFIEAVYKDCGPRNLGYFAN